MAIIVAMVAAAHRFHGMADGPFAQPHGQWTLWPRPGAER